MPTPVEVTQIKRSAVNLSGIEGLGGTWRDGPWYMSERNAIWEVERPDGERQWNFFVVIDGKNTPITVVSLDGRKYLGAAGRPLALLGLREWRDVDERGWPVRGGDFF
jgi:hypothetical protein